MLYINQGVIADRAQAKIESFALLQLTDVFYERLHFVTKKILLG